MHKDSKCVKCDGELVRYVRPTTRNKRREPLFCHNCEAAYRKGKVFDFFDLDDKNSKNASSKPRNKGALGKGSSIKEFEHEKHFCECGQRMKRGQSSWCDYRDIPYWRCPKCYLYFRDGKYVKTAPPEIARRYRNKTNRKKIKPKVVNEVKRQPRKKPKSKQQVTYLPTEQNLNPASVEVESSGECSYWGCTKEGYINFNRMCQQHFIQEQQTGS